MWNKIPGLMLEENKGQTFLVSKPKLEKKSGEGKISRCHVQHKVGP